MAHILTFIHIATLRLKCSIVVLHYQVSRTEIERDKKNVIITNRSPNVARMMFNPITTEVTLTYSIESICVTIVVR